ncbi:MAG: phosphoribosyltransferase [Spirochaetaceae bacterium]|jgi:hypoxanthine phosphoribosyltransferase|nr:phosphoribosyltransferase [Spirochaetaceae bacterium]
MQKDFVQYDVVRNNAIKLAYRIYKDGFIPDVIYVSLRGGAYLGNTISEYFKIIRGKERPVYYAAVVARSYVDIGRVEKVRVDGWTYSPEHLRTGDKILLLDDIFDTGRTVNYLANVILDKGIPRNDLKVGVHDYKYFYDKQEQLPVQPDYWCRKFDLSVKGEAPWVHYLSHELLGLSEEELEEQFFKEDESLREALSILKK